MPASQLLGGAVRFWHDQLFCKPAKHGGVVAWHQDYSYWTRTAADGPPDLPGSAWTTARARTDASITCREATLEARCPLPGLTGNMDEIKTVLTPEQQNAFRPVPIELKRGECSFHHPLLIHGSYENRSDRPRRATLINVFRDGVRSATDEELLAGVPPVPNGAAYGRTILPALIRSSIQ